MTVKELQQMIRIREEAEGDNPTEKSFLYLISQKLDELGKENEELKARLGNE